MHDKLNLNLLHKILTLTSFCIVNYKIFYMIPGDSKLLLSKSDIFLNTIRLQTSF